MHNCVFLQVNASKQTGAGTDKMYVPTLWYYDALNFLGSRSEPCRITPESIEDEEVNCIQFFIPTLKSRIKTAVS